MEEEISSSSSSSNSSYSWISDTNWNVTHGVLDNSISFETPISAIEEEPITPKDQLHLMKPSDSGPCEITISFKQKHEIRQVYVRSTARVYEIYYAADQQSSNEYLCTVRCCAAAKGDTSFHESDPGEAIVANQEGTIETMEHLAGKTKNDGNNGTGEDGWVEVKVPDSMADKNNRSTETSMQDFYEATAEISDANPCISLTLRLLSLQTQGCAHFEEIYIFAEPVDSADSENQVGPTENSAGSSLMAMLVPTLLNLSKTGNSRRQERHVFDIRERLNYHNDKSNETESLNPTIRMTKQLEEKAKVPDGATEVEEVTKGSADSTHSQSSEQVPSTGQGPEFVTKETDLPYGRIEKVLDHLVCRVVRLEAFCLRFEENMLKPISSIETKLQRLEKQLELLTMRSQPSEFYPSTRITAPEFSGTESQSNSLYNDDNCRRCKDALYTRITAPEFVCTESESNSFHHEGIDDQKDIYVAESSFPVDDAPPTSAVFRSCPGLVVTAPEFSNDDDDDDDECGDERDDGEKKCSEFSELDQKGCSRDKPSLSIEDALASALAGFLSMTSVQPPKLTKTSELITSEFLSEEHKLKSPSAAPFEQDLDTRSFCVGTGSNRKEHVNDSGSTSCCSSQGNEPQVMKLTTNESPAETENVPVLGQGQFQEIKESCENNTGINQTAGSQTSSSSSILISNGTVIDEQWFTTPTDETGTGTEKAAQLEKQLFAEQNYDKTAEDNTSSGACLDFTTAKETHCAEDNKNNSERVVLERTYSSTVDFELPILDVKFSPHENWNTAGSSLEFLLDDIDMPETKIEDFYVKDEDDGVASVEFLLADKPETNLEDFCVEDEDNGALLSNANSSSLWEDKGFDFSNLDEQLIVGIDDPTVETEDIQDSLTSVNHDRFSSLI